MQHLLIMGAGKVGTLIAFLLARSKRYKVFLADNQKNNPNIELLQNLNHWQHVMLDAKDESAVNDFIRKHDIQGVISSLPYYVNIPLAKAIAKNKVNYFDLTEDVQTTEVVQELAKDRKEAFVPQCGLAPGFISIVANNLMEHFPLLDTVKMRVGALPINISNALQYSLTWSTAGLINEYGNPCPAIEDGKSVLLQPLEGLEEIKIDGLTYEAFNTSGGIGSLADTYCGKVKNLSYKTIRYPGHCEKVKFLMNDLKLNQDRETLKNIFERALPKTFQDVALVYVSVAGQQDGEFIEENYVKKFYPRVIDDITWSAIQMTTASSICAAVDIVMQNPKKYHGIVRQEQFALQDFLKNPFGHYFAEEE